MKKASVIAYALVFLTFLTLERQLSVLADYPYNFVVRCIAVFLFVYGLCAIKKISGRLLFWSFSLGFVLPDIIVRIIENSLSGIRMLPDLLIEILAVLAAYHLYKTRRIWGSVVAAALCSGAILFGAVPWLHWVQYGNISGKVNTPVVRNWAVYNQQGDTFAAADYGGKIVVLDVWNTGCGICFRKFPQLETLYRQYKDNPGISIQALNVPLERDTVGMAFQLIKRQNYTFPVVVGIGRIDSLLGIEAYPTILILRNNTEIFRGNIEEVGAFLQSLNVSQKAGTVVYRDGPLSASGARP